MMKMGNENEKYWELVKIEMQQAYAEHQSTGIRTLDVIKQWLIVVTFPFLVIGSLIAFMDKTELNILIHKNWLFDIPEGIRPFFVFSGIISFILINLHTSIDLHKMICRNAMNSFRGLHQTALKIEFDKLVWRYPIRTDLLKLKFIDITSNTFWFTLFGGGLSIFYCLIGFGCKQPLILILGSVVGSIAAILLRKSKFSFENFINGLIKMKNSNNPNQ